MLACISGCSGVIGCKVATGGALRVKKFAQHGLIVGVSVKKFALRARNTPHLTFLRLLGELCHGLSGGEGVPGELCRGEAVAGRCRARFVEWQSLLVCSAWEVLPRYREYPGPRCRSSVSPLV